MTQQLLTESLEKTQQHVESREPRSDSAPSLQGGFQPIHQLQRMLGNRNVAKLIQAKRLTPEGKIIGLQRKLTVGATDDQYEQEADRVARQVMRMPDPVAQRQCKGRSDGFAPSPSDEEEPQIQRQANGEGGSGEVASDFTSRLGAGAPLDTASRAYFEPRFGHDFGNVRIHSGPQAYTAAASVQARAFTLGRDVVFAAGEHDPRSEIGKRLLAHELTHVVQQSGADGIHVGEKRGLSPSLSCLQQGLANKTSASYAVGNITGTNQSVQLKPLPPAYAGVTGIEDPGSVLIDGITDFFADSLTASRNINVNIAEPTATHLCWELYDPNDHMVGGYCSLPGSPDSTNRPFTLEPQDFPVPGFVAGKYLLRCSGLNARHQPVVYYDREFNVFSRTAFSFSLGTTRGLSADSSRLSIPAIPPSPVMAHFVPGTSNERALVLGGVHGSEQSGVEVVEALRTLLANPALPRPYFNIILIPVLFPDNLAYDRAYRAANPGSRGTDLGPRVGGRYTRLGNAPTDMREPNRNYPTPGTSLETALSEDVTQGIGGRPTTVPPPTGTTVVNQPLLPETRMLLSLIQSFRPSRIASVHGHRPSTRTGDAPGIYVDPRPDDPATTAINETTRDEDLARRMLRYARRRGLTGSNPADDVHYLASHPTGASLGDWGPNPVDEGARGVADRPGDRPGITTITVEVEGYSPSAEDAQMARRIQIHSQTLLEVFLARP